MPVPSLAELRLAIGRKGFPLRQKELAQIAQIDPGYLSALESGKRRPSAYVQIKLATALDIPLPTLNASVTETLRRHKVGEDQLRLTP